MSAALQNFSVGAGNDALITVTVESGTVGDTLVGSTIYWEVYPQKSGIVPNAALPLITKTNNSGGGDLTVLGSPPMTFTIQLDEADTLGLIGNYYHEAVAIDETGGRVTVLAGIMTVTQALII